jgi:hypothetical protein
MAVSISIQMVDKLTADVLVDGASATNFEQNSGIQNVPYVPSVDSVEEFKVQQANFTAGWIRGRNSGKRCHALG